MPEFWAGPFAVDGIHMNVIPTQDEPVHFIADLWRQFEKP